VEQNKFKIFLKEETGPYELPKGWQWVKLGEVANVYYGKGLPQNQRRANGQYWAYGSNGPIYKTDFYLIEPPTIIMGRKGSIGAVTLVLDKCWPIDTTYYFKIKEKATNINYLYWYLKTIDFSKIAITTTKPGLNRDDLNSTKIPLPSLPEQKRIVARIEALFSKIDEIKKLRKEANDLAKTLLPSALHEVFSKADEKGWRWVRLGEIVKKDKFSIVDGPFGTQLHTSDYVSSGVPLIRIKNFKYNFEFDESDLKFISEEKFEELKRSAVFPGDIILAKTGATIGKVCIFPSKFEKGLITSSCAKISVDRNIVDNKFVIFALATEKVQKQILILSSGSTRPSLTLSQVADLEIPLPFKNGQPALDEQKRIVSYLDQISEKQKTLLKIYADIDNQITELKQSIEVS